MQHNELRTSFKSIDLILSPDHGRKQNNDLKITQNGLQVT